MFNQEKTQTKVDLTILLKLQRRLKDLEEENRSLWQQLDKKEEAQQEKAKVCKAFLLNRALEAMSL